MRFARLFNFPTGQLLLFIDTDEETDCYILRIETYHNGVFIRSGIPFSNFGDASEAMDELTEEKAETLHASLIGIAEDPAPRNNTISPRQADGSVEGLEDWINNSKN
jgi:hypothetical protein